MKEKGKRATERPRLMETCDRLKSVLLLESIHQVIRVEKLLKARGLRIDLIPIPREISSDCGMAVELPLDAETEALRILEENRIPVRDLYVRDSRGTFQQRRL
jgi:hypothetical protein